ncbi:MAG: 4Fe-4S binding protein [Oscillospiraceae bacterium]|nr:4Fe-4S binding protein [Oscillospiraceae bacterium]
MAHTINDQCVSCGVCVGECPVDAISSGSSQYVIDEGVCIDCGACVGACPAEAISG